MTRYWWTSFAASLTVRSSRQGVISDMTRSAWLTIALIVIVVGIAWVAFTRTHPAGLPNFHW